MLLSIGMIVKNEEKNLDKCLGALKPILEKVDSELIIADTGSTDRTVEIAKKYTDNVFYFEWINDFAAARNSTVQRAKGEWFMFIDGDEIFSDCTDIIEFFNSGEYKSYNSATYIQRNYEKEDLSSNYSDFNAPRMTKLLPNTAFELPIHESLNTFGSPRKVLRSVVDHFGYAYSSSPELEKRKFERNSALLLKRYETEKDRSPLIYMQLFDCYISQDKEKAYEYLFKGIEFCKKHKNPLIAGMYHSWALDAYSKKRYEEAAEVCSTYFDECSEMRTSEWGTDAEIHGMRAAALHALNKYSEAHEHYISYFRLYRDLMNGKLNTDDTYVHIWAVACESNYVNMHTDFILNCIGLKKYNTAAEYMKLVPLKEHISDHVYMESRIYCETEIMANIGFGRLNRFYAELDDYEKTVLVHCMRRIIFRYRDIKAVQALEKLPLTDEAEKDLMMLYGSLFRKNDLTAAALGDFCSKHTINGYPEIMYFMAEINADLTPFIMSEGCDLALCAVRCTRDFEGFGEALGKYDISALGTQSLISAAKLCIYVMEEQIILGQSIESVFSLFGRIGERTAAESGKLVLPAESVAAVIAGTAEKCRAERNIRGCIEALKQMLRAFPGSKNIVMAYQNILKKML